VSNQLTPKQTRALTQIACDNTFCELHKDTHADGFRKPLGSKLVSVVNESGETIGKGTWKSLKELALIDRFWRSHEDDFVWEPTRKGWKVLWRVTNQKA